jgi:hypothetical protein
MGMMRFLLTGSDASESSADGPAGTPAAQGLASCRQFYAGAGDISATGDVARMSCRPGHDGGMRVLRRKRGDPPLIETVVGKGYRM